MLKNGETNMFELTNWTTCGECVLEDANFSVLCLKESAYSKAYYVISGSFTRDDFIKLKNLPDPETYWQTNSKEQYIEIYFEPDIEDEKNEEQV